MNELEKKELIKYISSICLIAEEDIDPNIFDVIDYVNMLNEVDTDNITEEETTYSMNNLYEDKVIEFQNHEQIISEAPISKENCFVSPNPTNKK